MPAVLTENISAYAERTKLYPRITKEDEIQLATLMQTGTPEERAAARERLICANLRLVIKIAHDFKKFGLGFADLVSEGNVGLMTAADKFDPGKGAKFSCYAAWWIKQSMRKALVTQSRLVYIPGKSAQVAMNIAKARREYSLEHDEEPDKETLAELAGCKAATVDMLDHAVTEVVSMHELVQDSEDEATFEVVLADSDSGEHPEMLSRMHDALDGLSGLDRHIIDSVYGLSGHRSPVLLVAQEVGLSVDAVNNRIAALLLRLRNILE